ncbi:hypothetical protein EVAR_69516_1 [Eumeta japonica]|uniref:Uncharacterized protein n=1 Tax=Eumeta variegata TaxID=151549 RepID=A0A4C2AD62_EUMVA|nr:hypothetical protein EVAR_69516_1 [Eumeta japonica]
MEVMFLGLFAYIPAHLAYDGGISSPTNVSSNDGSTSPKRLVPRADVPLHHLSEEDVRTQLGSLKSFKPKSSNQANGSLTTNPQPYETDIDSVDATKSALHTNSLRKQI